MKITEEEKQERKERIVRKAFQLFCSLGIEKVSLSDIARQSDVGCTSIYRYFSNKVQLVLETMSVLWIEISRRLEEAVEATENYEMMTGYEQIRVQLDGCKNLYLNNSDYILFSYEAKLYLLRNHVQLVNSQYELLMSRIKDSYVRAIEKGKDDGTIHSNENSEDLFYAIWGAVRGYVVKIVIYGALCSDGGPWKDRYNLLEEGLLSALVIGWNKK